MKADATPVPDVSERTRRRSALSRLRKTDAKGAEAFKALSSDPEIARELNSIQQSRRRPFWRGRRPRHHARSRRGQGVRTRVRAKGPSRRTGNRHQTLCDRPRRSTPGHASRGSRAHCRSPDGRRATEAVKCSLGRSIKLATSRRVGLWHCASGGDFTVRLTRRRRT